MKATLFDIVGEYQRLYEMAVDDEAESEQVFLDTLESIKGELDVKASGYLAVITRLESEAFKADEVSKAYQDAADRRLNAVKRMKETLISAMDAMNVTEMPAGELTIKIQKNGGLQPMVIDKPEDVPDNLTKVTIEPDNKKIRDYLKDHPDCKFAHLEERGRHIKIK